MSKKTLWVIVFVVALLFFVTVSSGWNSSPEVVTSKPTAGNTILPSPTSTHSPIPTQAPSPSSPPEINTFLTMLAELPEDNTPLLNVGYDRDFFRVWIDADGDGCNTRAEVLLMESQTVTTQRETCTIETGKWLSVYDHQTFTQASEVDVDHVVPLNEAWMSGAYAWDAQTRVSFGNDLGYEHSLMAVSSRSNSSKSDNDPSQWLPSAQEYVCEYAATWVAVKWRWNLSVDAFERSTLESILSGCVSVSIAIPERAIIVLAPPNDGSITQQPGLDQNYGTCQVARSMGKGPYIRGMDPEYEWYRDRDNDGIVCE